MMISLNLNEYNIRLDSSSKILILNESNLSFVVVTNFVYQLKNVPMSISVPYQMQDILLNLMQ